MFFFLLFFADFFFSMQTILYNITNSLLIIKKKLIMVNKIIIIIIKSYFIISSLNLNCLRKKGKEIYLVRNKQRHHSLPINYLLWFEFINGVSIHTTRVFST